eukprot:1145531-Pelagomonas_calceolata.AAC.8
MLSAFTATLDLLCATFVEHLIGLPTLCTDAQPPHINRMHTICHIEALSICGEKLAREALAPTLLLWMHAIEEGPPLQVPWWRQLARVDFCARSSIIISGQCHGALPRGLGALRIFLLASTPYREEKKKSKVGRGDSLNPASIKEKETGWLMRLLIKRAANPLHHKAGARKGYWGSGGLLEALAPEPGCEEYSCLQLHG